LSTGVTLSRADRDAGEGASQRGAGVASGELAFGALRAAARAEIAVPGALAITGWDDSEAASAAGLTSVAQSLRDQGIRCAQLALGKAAPAKDDARASWRVIERRTTRPSPREG
jgi:DNA-binding LacI/PurR family transcriptional regulator